MTKITLNLPEPLYELLDKANLLLPENALMFYTAGLLSCMEWSTALRKHIHESGISLNDLYKLAGVVSMEAAEKALIIKNTDA